MSLTITIPGAVEATTGAVAPATLTIGVGTPGATGPAGPAGAGVPAGGSSGQYLQKTSGLDYATDWVTLPANYITSVTAPLAVTSGNLSVNLSAYAPLASPAFTGDPTAPTATFGDNDTSISTTAFVQAALAGGTAVAKNLEVYVRNQSGSTIAAGSIVYISGATGNRPLITLAQANNDANSAQTIGFVKTSIANNGFGNVIIRGELEDLDTSALTEGAQLYLSPTTAGTWTTTKPSAPQHLVYVGIVLRSHPTQGTILVAVQNGYELGEIHDVALSSPANLDLLTYESSTDLWKNKSFSTLGLLTSADAASTYQTISGMSSYLTTASAASTYQTLSGMSSYLTTSAAASTYYLQTNPSGFITSASLSGYAQLSGATFTGEVSTPASTTSSAGLSILPGTAPTSPVNGEIWNTGSDIQVQLGGVTETLAEQSWVSTNYAPKASPALTGNVTITANSASPALIITQDGAGDIVQFKDVTSDTTYTFIDANGKVTTIASDATAGAGFNIAHGVAPTSPVNGDIWTTTGGLFWRQNGTTYQAMNLSATQTVSGSITFSNATLTLGNSTAASTYNLGTGATLTATTKAINIGTNGVSGSTTNIAIGSTTGTNAITINGPTTLAGTLTASGTTVTLGNSTAASTINLGTGATLTATTKTVNIGTSGVAGSTTNIAIGSTTGTSTTTLQGSTVGTTLAADTNTTGLATTAYVIGQAGSATPLINGTAAVGTSLRYARQDHVHPTDTSRAALASPTFTGVPAAPTATAGTNTTQLATTAFVTAAVPGFATTAEIASPSSTTKVVAPFDVVRMLVNRATFDTQNSSPTFATSGAGATAYKMTNDRTLEIGTPNVGVAGYGQMIYDTTAGAWGALGAKRGDNFFTQDFSKKIWMSGTHCFTLLGDANTTAYCMMGGRNTVTTGQPTMQGFGWKLVGGGTALKLITYGYDGVSLVLTETTSSFTPVANQTFDWMLLNEGTGAGGAGSTCKLYVNDSLVASGVNAPGGATVNYNYLFNSFESTSSMATRLSSVVFPIKLWWSKS